MALILLKGASSTDSSASDDEVIIEGASACRRRFSEDEDSDCSSEPQSIASSFLRMNILDSSNSEQDHDNSFSLLVQEELTQCKSDDVFSHIDKNTILYSSSQRNVPTRNQKPEIS
jgi:hypothetical protein